MSKTVRTIVAVGTLLVTLACLGLSILGLTLPHWGLFGVGLALTGVFSVFVYHDAKFFFNKENK